MLGNHLDVYNKTSGTLHIEFDIVAERLEQHGLATRIEEKEIELVDGETRRFIIMKTDDLKRAYTLLHTAYLYVM
jgi:hypothetical protein